jgi:integrase
VQNLPNIKNNEETINKYRRYLDLQGYKFQTIFNKVWVLVPFFDFICHKKAEEVKKEDIEDYIVSCRKTKKQNTVDRYAIELRFFFKWLNPDNNLFENIKTHKEKNRLPSTSILTPSEAMSIIKEGRNQRDRAFLFVLWDSAARLNEILSLKKRDVQFDQYGCVITVTGKTGMRRIRLIDSVPDLQLWINQHTGKLDDPLFPALPKIEKFSRRGAQNVVVRAAERAKIEKNVHAHLFRHSKLTDLTKKGLGEMELRIFAGWENSSNMPATYLHLSGKDVEDKILAINGIKPIEKEEEQVKPTLKVCPRCNTNNPFDAIYCRTCSMILDQTTATNIESSKSDISKEFFISALQDPEIQELLKRLSK